MGKGDKKSKRGKINRGTYGVRRPRKSPKPVVVAKKAKPKAKPKAAAKTKPKAESKAKAAAKPKAAAKSKATAKPKAAAKTTKGKAAPKKE